MLRRKQKGMERGRERVEEQEVRDEERFSHLLASWVRAQEAPPSSPSASEAAAASVLGAATLPPDGMVEFADCVCARRIERWGKGRVI